MGGGSSGPDANPDMWILKCAQANLPAFRNAEHLGPAKNSACTETSDMSPEILLVSQATPSE